MDVVYSYLSLSLSHSRVFVVVDAIDQTYGKYPASLGNVLVLDKSFVANLLQLAFGGIVTNPLFQTITGGQPGPLQSIAAPINLNVRFLF